MLHGGGRDKMQKAIPLKQNILRDSFGCSSLILAVVLLRLGQPVSPENYESVSFSRSIDISTVHVVIVTFVAFRVLFLAEGRVAYLGTASKDASNFFSQ